jgi:hypothetical protein
MHIRINLYRKIGRKVMSFRSETLEAFILKVKMNGGKLGIENGKTAVQLDD